MRTRRRFQPTVDGLPYRIALSTAVAIIPADTAAPPASNGPTMTPYDADPPQTGTISPIIVAPPPTTGGGTLTC
jgi:hypothetical protein